MPPPRDAVPKQSGYETNECCNEEGLNKAVDSVLLDKFEASTPTADFPSPLSVFGLPLFQRGLFWLGVEMFWEKRRVFCH